MRTLYKTIEKKIQKVPEWTNRDTAKKGVQGVGDGERDVEDAGAADRAEEADERGGGASEKAWNALRDRLLSKHSPFLAFWRVSFPHIPSLSQP